MSAAENGKPAQGEGQTAVPRNVILQGDALERLRELPDECVQTCISSPPYWSQRDYGTATWEGGDLDCNHSEVVDAERTPWANAVPGPSGLAKNTPAGHWKPKETGGTCASCGAVRIDQQIGLEATPDEWVARLVEVFREVRRVLRGDGTLWLNAGDAYAGSWGAQSRGGPPSDKSTLRGNGHVGGGPKLHSLSATQFVVAPHFESGTGSLARTPGLKSKDLIGLPWMLAFALRADGWYLRSDIVWQKLAPMPESVQDRPTRSHEFLFLLAKSEQYFYDAPAVAEPAGRFHAAGKGSRMDNDRDPAHGTSKQDAVGKSTYMGFNARWALKPTTTRNRRDVWSLSPAPFPEAHFATFPEALVRPCILAGTSERGACETCGAPWRRVVERERAPRGDAFGRKDVGRYDHGQAGSGYLQVVATHTAGWAPTCRCQHNTGATRCLVLDPFSGSGTVAVVAAKYGRDYLGIDLNAQYCDMARKRLSAIPGYLWTSTGSAEEATP